MKNIPVLMAEDAGHKQEESYYCGLQSISTAPYCQLTRQISDCQSKNISTTFSFQRLLPLEIFPDDADPQKKPEISHVFRSRLWWIIEMAPVSIRAPSRLIGSKNNRRKFLAEIPCTHIEGDIFIFNQHPIATIRANELVTGGVRENSNGGTYKTASGDIPNG